MLRDERSSDAQRMVVQIIARLLDAGYTLAVNDGEERTTPFVKDPGVLYDALCTTEYDNLLAHSRITGKTYTVMLVWGNGEDVLADYSGALAPVLDPLIDEFFE